METLVETFEIGDKVEHGVFGVGTVMQKIGDGERLKLLVRFQSKEVGEKKLSVRYAKLKRLSDRPTLTAVPEAAPVAKAISEGDAKPTVIKKTIVPAAAAAGSTFVSTDEDEEDDELAADEFADDDEDEDEDEEEFEDEDEDEDDD